MVALRASEINRFIASGGREQPLALVFGADEGLVRARMRALVEAALGKAHDPLLLVEFDAEALNDDPPRLVDEANAISMFGGRRAIIVRNAGKLAKAAWQPLFEVPPLDSIVIFQGDDLSKTNALRVAAEGNPKAAAIICYPPQSADMAELIDQRCKAAGVTIAAPARTVLVELLGQDYALSVSEIDKLLLYARGKLTIEIADIEAIVADTSEGAASEALDLAFEGRLEAVERAAHRAMQDSTSAPALTILALNHALMLRRLVSARQAGSFDTAIRNERVFFRRQDRVRSQSQNWDQAGLTRALETLATAQEQGRRMPALEDAILVRALWSIALGAARRG